MANLPLTLTAADYARLMPLATRMVEPDGIDLPLLLGTAGSWPERASMLRRASLRACGIMSCSSVWVAGPVSGSTVMRPEGATRKVVGGPVTP